SSVFDSGQFVLGPEVKTLEAKIAAFCQSSFSVGCASGSDALLLALMAADIGVGDEVIVPAWTFIATASTVAFCGGTPVFCDVDPESFLIDLDYAETLITNRTRAIAPVHLFGNACDVDAIEAFAAKHNLRIVWDAAQAHGTTINGRDVGSIGEFVTYSFYPSKTMFVGEGGMTCTSSEDLAAAMRSKRAHGQSRKYYHDDLGLNLRITDVEAAIGNCQLKRLDDIIAARRANAAALDAGLLDLPGLKRQRVTDGCEHAWHQYCITIDADEFGMTRDALKDAMGEAGIATGIHYPRGLHRQPVFVDRFGTTDLPVCDHLAETILAIPVHQGLTSSDLNTIVESVQSNCSAAV
ncbi:MAG: DegT/DnrJ/EryC1/StrS family aminotransferase, partial [Pirellulaceae bacterium]|nr:DegT/DnrJ/EryC1/StrS family aminotransferase [Pirellulaceae bacterium]